MSQPRAQPGKHVWLNDAICVNIAMLHIAFAEVGRWWRRWPQLVTCAVSAQMFVRAAAFTARTYLVDGFFAQW